VKYVCVCVCVCVWGGGGVRCVGGTRNADNILICKSDEKRTLRTL
jgi:hypothetical protein